VASVVLVIEGFVRSISYVFEGESLQVISFPCVFDGAQEAAFSIVGDDFFGDVTQPNAIDGFASFWIDYFCFTSNAWRGKGFVGEVVLPRTI